MQVYFVDPKSYITEIKDDFLRSLYENFELSINDLFFGMEPYLFEYLKNTKFITYCVLEGKEKIISSIENINNKHKLICDIMPDDLKSISNNEIPPVANAIFCIENNLIIREFLSIEIINKTINQLKNEDISLINVGQNDNTNIFTSDELKAKEEINSFISNFENQINQNNFLYYTIRPVVGYLIRRNYYPTSYFENPSFFPSYESAFNPKIIKRFTKIINSQKFLLAIYNLIKLFKMRQIKSKNQINLQEFQIEDFIKLRSQTKDLAKFSLVFHKPTFHVFMMKTVDDHEIIETELKHELDFNMKHLHRCITKCYGFVKENGSLIGFVYEFMSNSTLQDFFKKHQNLDNKAFKMMILIRIMQGIEYLHSNSLIHRDIKPDNILFDHDFLPYLSDFDKIREPNENMTANVGSMFYTSPEQNGTNNASFPTDIFSFGIIIYYLFEKKDLNIFCLSKKDIQTIIKKVSSSSDIPNSFKDLIHSCVKFYAFERPNIENVKKMVNDEVDSFLYFEEYFLQKNVNINQLIFYLHDIFLLYYTDNKLVQFCNNFYICFNLYAQKIRDNLALSLCEIGTLYGNGIGSLQNYSKALELLELSIKENSSDLIKSSALYSLGNHYLNGYGVIRNYKKAIDYFEKSAQLNNPKAQFSLGYLYKKGLGVKQDYSLAKKYYELSSMQNNSEALLGLGNIYQNGLGVKQDFLTAKKYFDKSAKLNNSRALYCLGMFFENGWGVEQNYVTAKEYYELAANQSNSGAIIRLGVYYEKGLGVKKNYKKAKEYYELATKLKDDFGFVNLANIYELGLGEPPDLSKALHLYEKSAEKNYAAAFYKLACFYINHNKDYLKAIEYLEKSAELNYSEAFLYLGFIYLKGLGVEIDYLKAKNYFELCTKYNNSNGYFNLGVLYRFGLGVEKDIKKSIQYFESSCQLNNPLAYHLLGSMYSNGELKLDFNKAINYFSECIKIKTYSHDPNDKYFTNSAINLELNYCRDISNNDLGLIYLFINNDYDNSLKCIKESAYDEYPIGQNNYGLFLEFFLNKGEEAEYFYQKASRNNLDLADFNLGHYYEKNMQKDKSITYYKKAIEHNDDTLVYHEIFLNDKRLNESMKIIFFLANLKLAYYYINEGNIKDFKKYLVNAFSKTAYKNDAEVIFFIDVQNNQLCSEILEIIKNTIKTIEDTLYKPPYTILFGRYGIEKMQQEPQQENSDQSKYAINQDFYEGFDGFKF